MADSPKSDEVLEKRTTFSAGTLAEGELHANPLEQLKIWLVDADNAGLKEPNAMALATASTDGTPSVRIVLLRKVDERGLFFFTNYESRKGRELQQNPRASLCFYFVELERQARVEGMVSRSSQAESLAYFHARPRASQLAAWTSAQSQRISGRQELEAQYAAVEKKYAGQAEIPLPPFWGGFLLKPHHFEFWQGRENRLHDRITYRQEGRTWLRERLAP